MADTLSFTSTDEHLSEPIKSFTQLQSLICKTVPGLRELHGLIAAIEEFTIYVHNSTSKSDWNFITDLLPNIQEWAQDSRYLGKQIAVLPSNCVRTVELEEEHVRHILANSFFGYNQRAKNLDQRFGLLNFYTLYGDNDNIGVARITCLLSYFYTTQQTPPSGNIITFQRVSLDGGPPQGSQYTGPMPPDWGSCDTQIQTNLIHIHNGKMEDPTEATAFVDFANFDLHIHTVDPSATQEEVLFSMCPEAFPGIMFCARMTEKEAIIIRGCRRFCDYKGYLSTFSFEKAFIPPLPAQDIIAIDATFNNHFSPQRIVRDLNKAFIGFLQCTGDRNKISTGHWGCGAFGGNKLHKFLIQLCAATLANTGLYYSAYNDNDCISAFTSTLQSISEKGLTVKELFNIMVLYKDQQRNVQFNDFMKQQLDTAKSACQLI